MNAIESLLVFLVLGPLLIGLHLFIMFSVSPYQITYEGFISTRMSEAQFVPALPPIIFTVIVMVSILVPILIIFTALGTWLVLLLIASRKSYWERKLNKLVENGFV